ncbi:hypothetical protein [Nocardioides massiliensis]|uniref:DivIVA domain-containing protein n=1 Tax=Nocardioides massiliensis TaxID=1325935 RepID=A0ABT9NIZ9_9ACTN|nr:hypothetical protein [Nocardioides massiliensis]MDP9820388.1 hypothetical protein [Nocardioides massiliensis]
MSEASTYNLGEPAGKVRLLLNDVAAPWVFSDDEIEAFLDMEGDNVKLAAAQAIDTNADDQLLASKVLRTQDVTTDGAKLADSMRRRAAALRAQAADETADDEDSFFFGVVNLEGSLHPERTQYPVL